MLLEEQQSIATTIYETGLSTTSRLHDLFVKIEGMTPGEYKNGGQVININYSFAESPFGKLTVAFLIPCDRVIQSSGTFDGYMWGPTRKAAMIGWEAAKLEQKSNAFRWSRAGS